MKRPVVYDRVNRELRAVWRFFAEHPGAPVKKFEWRPEAELGQAISPGTPLATISFENNDDVVEMVAPAGCQGVVADRAEDPEELLGEQPACYLLGLE